MDLEQYSSHTYVYGGVVPAKLAEILRSSPGGTIADFGCGDGTLLMALRDAGLLDGRSGVGVEGSATRVDRLRSRWPELSVINADVCDVGGLADGSVDVVVSTQVIEHVPDDGAMLAEMHRVLRPGGTLYLTTIFKRRYGWYFYRCQGRWALDPTHLREYGADGELLPRVASTGFVLGSESKTPIRFALIDPLFRLAKAWNATGRLVSGLRRVKFRVPGYFEWEIVATKPSAGPVAPLP